MSNGKRSRLTVVAEIAGVLSLIVAIVAIIVSHQDQKASDAKSQPESGKTPQLQVITKPQVLTSTERNCDYLISATTPITKAYDDYASAFDDYLSFKNRQYKLVLQRYPYPHDDGWQIAMAKERNDVAQALKEQINNIPSKFLSESSKSADEFNSARNRCAPHAKPNGTPEPPCQTSVLDANAQAVALTKRVSTFRAAAQYQYADAASAASAPPADASVNIAVWRNNVGTFDKAFADMDDAASGLKGVESSLGAKTTTAQSACK